MPETTNISVLGVYIEGKQEYEHHYVYSMDQNPPYFSFYIGGFSFLTIHLCEQRYVLLSLHLLDLSSFHMNMIYILLFGIAFHESRMYFEILLNYAMVDKNDRTLFQPVQYMLNVTFLNK